MIDLQNFKLWLIENKSFSKRTVGNIVSRFKRACMYVNWESSELFLYKLEKNEEFLSLSTSVKSQIRKSVKLYLEFCKDHVAVAKKKCNLKALSLFSNIGVAEAYLDDLGVNVVVANELVERRALLYSQIYPETHMICGDVTNKHIKEKIIDSSIENDVDVIMATPPCQGMSTAGTQNLDDERNRLILDVLEIIQSVNPRYVFIENVPMFYKTMIEMDGNRVLIPEIIKSTLGDKYIIKEYLIDTKNYSVPQTRERAVILMTRKDQTIKWELPKKDKKIITMKDAIGHLPTLDPYVKDVSENEMKELFPDFEFKKRRALEISKWHTPPHHIKRQVIAMQHTPSGKTAFDNEVYFPIKENGEPVKGYRNTYKRQNWDTPAYTVTMDNRKISSQNNVHPGRLISNDLGDEIFSDPRTLTLYELMIIMTLPENWNIPENTSEAFLRRIIGEGIPPLFVKKVFQEII